MNTAFYQNIKEITDFHQISDDENYHDVPQDWYIALTDVVNSTIAIEEGRYKDVNIAGGLAAIALGNLYKNLDHPFVFGGDGITFLIPGEYAEDVRSILADTRLKVKALFDLELRIALIPVSEIYQKKLPMKMAKFKVSDRYSQAIFAGEGFQLAETLLKTENSPWLITEQTNIPLTSDFSGFTCRWHDIPSHHGETLSLIISFTANNSKDNRVKKVLQQLEEILGAPENYRPIQDSTLRITDSAENLSKEALVFAGKRGSFKYYVLSAKIRVEKVISQIAMAWRLPIRAMTYKLKDLKKYNILSSDFRKFDGSLKMVVATSTANRQKLVALLTGLENQNQIKFGYHIADRALLTCILHTGSVREVHFVDGANGGYALAAKMLKSK